MMSIYVGCLLVWKPFISIGILGSIFLGFYYLLNTAGDIRQLPEGDEINYITFFISLTMVSISMDLGVGLAECVAEVALVDAVELVCGGEMHRIDDVAHRRAVL